MLGALATISGTTIYPTPPGQDNPSPTSQDAPEIHPPALVTMNSETYTIQHSIVQIAGVTVSEGAPATTISNTPISLGTNHLMIGKHHPIQFSISSTTRGCHHHERRNLDHSKQRHPIRRCHSLRRRPGNYHQ